MDIVRTVQEDRQELLSASARLFGRIVLEGAVVHGGTMAVEQVDGSESYIVLCAIKGQSPGWFAALTAIRDAWYADRTEDDQPEPQSRT